MTKKNNSPFKSSLRVYAILKPTFKKYCIIVYIRTTKKNQEAQGSKLKHILEKGFLLNTEPNDNLSLNIEPVEDLNSTSFSNGFLSVHNELSDDININKEDQQQQRINKKDEPIVFDLQSVDMIFQIVRKGTEAAIKAEQAAKEALIISERNQNTLAEISEQIHGGRAFLKCIKNSFKPAIYPTNSEMCEVIDAEVELQNPQA
ncbi:hypothetical protein C1646_814112 [Rhizophagus diaphanus]|nr:hypothetical protein C1646_814112 [Rhizophagus diaphanus] [Rhizophagus sp. MUCL 43196]